MRKTDEPNYTKELRDFFDSFREKNPDVSLVMVAGLAKLVEDDPEMYDEPYVHIDSPLTLMDGNLLSMVPLMFGFLNGLLELDEQWGQPIIRSMMEQALERCE